MIGTWKLEADDGQYWHLIKQRVKRSCIARWKPLVVKGIKKIY